MEEEFIFITHDMLEKMIIDCKNDLIPVMIIDENGNGSVVTKYGKDACKEMAVGIKTITCEYGEMFNDVCLYRQVHQNLHHVARNGDKVIKMLITN